MFLFFHSFSVRDTFAFFPFARIDDEEGASVKKKKEEKKSLESLSP